MRILLILILLLASCSTQQNAAIILINDSGMAFDSTVITVNDFRIKTGEVVQKGRSEIIIPLDSVHINGHDVSIRASLFSNKGNDTLSGFFYTDLGGGLSGKYVIQATKERKVIITSMAY